jgi:hypothetical protein
LGWGTNQSRNFKTGKVNKMKKKFDNKTICYQLS